MKQYLYLKSDAIQVVTAKGKNLSYETVELPQGLLLNGVIIQPDALQAQFAKLSKKLKTVTLMIDSSNIITKKITLPKVAAKQLDEIIKGEFDLFGREDLHLFDYSVLEDKAGVITVLAHAATKELVESYQQLLKKLKIKIDRIDVVMNGLVKYIGQKPLMQDETFVLNVIAADSMLSLLFENGEFVFANRSRLLQQGDPAAYAQELNMRLSALVQFNRSQKSEHSISKSYYIGLSTEMLHTFSAYLKEAESEIAADSMADHTFEMEYLYPCLGMVKLKNDVNLDIDKQLALKKERARKTTLAYLAGAAVLCALAVVQFSYMLDKCEAIEAENADLEMYLVSATVTDATTNYALLTAQQAEVTAENAEIQTLIANLTYAKTLKADILTDLFETDYITYLNYSLSSASFSLEGESETHAEAADYAESIRKLGHFDILRYEGFEGASVTDEEGNVTASYYEFEMEMSFAAQESEASND